MSKTFSMLNVNTRMSLSSLISNTFHETQPHRTIIGFGSTKEGSHDVHGAPLKADDMAQMKEKFGLPADPFTVKDEVCVGGCCTYFDFSDVLVSSHGKSGLLTYMRFDLLNRMLVMFSWWAVVRHPKLDVALIVSDQHLRFNPSGSRVFPRADRHRSREGGCLERALRGVRRGSPRAGVCCSAVS